MQILKAILKLQTPWSNGTLDVLIKPYIIARCRKTPSIHTKLTCINRNLSSISCFCLAKAEIVTFKHNLEICYPHRAGFGCIYIWRNVINRKLVFKYNFFNKFPLNI
jgi:hypothetical protein